MNFFIKYARKIVIATVGASLLVIGVILIILPGPGLLLILAGLLVLSVEFAWAERHVHKVRSKVETTKAKLKK